MLAIPELKRLKQKDAEYEVGLGSILKVYLNNFYFNQF